MTERTVLWHARNGEDLDLQYVDSLITEKLCLEVFTVSFYSKRVLSRLYGSNLRGSYNTKYF